MCFLILIAIAGQDAGPKLPPPAGSQTQTQQVPPDPIESRAAGTDVKLPPAAATQDVPPPALPKPHAKVKGKPVNRKIDLSPKAQTFIRDLALIAIPDEFDDDKKWGATKRVQSGLSVKLDGGKLRTHRKWKNVKHGRWQKYNIKVIEPEKRFQLKILNVVKTPKGPYHFDIVCTARLRVEGRWQDWRLGVPLLRVTTDALTDVRLDAHCELDFDFDYSAFPPSVQLKPVVHAANVRIGKFEVRRLGHVKGRVAEEFSGAIKSVLTREIAKRRKDLPKKINKKIAKKEDDLKISVGEWLKFSKEDEDEKSAKKPTTPRKK